MTGFDVAYQIDNELWTGWITDTMDTEATFVGEAGHTYNFRVTATDRVGNVGQDEASVEVYSVTKYYSFNGQRVAMRRCGDSECGEAIYLHGDHLGSVSLATDHTGNLVSQARYLPYGQMRWSGDTVMPTKFSYTGQRADGFGLMDYHARFYSSRLGRFISADSIIPNASVPQAFDRFGYVFNNPLKYIDPTGNLNGQPPLSNQQCGPDMIYCGGLGDDDTDVPTSSGVDLVQLTAKGEIIYELYEQYRMTPGWWNHGIVASLSIEQFVGMYILMESTTKNANTTRDAADILSTIFAQNLFEGGWNPPVCETGGTCFNAVFNFIASIIDGSSALLSGPDNLANQRFAINNPSLGTPDEIRGLINTLGVKALNPNSVVADKNHGPSIWGNIKGAAELLKLLPKTQNGKIIFGTADNTIYHFIPDSAIYLSVNQYNHWILLVDMTLIGGGE